MIGRIIFSLTHKGDVFEASGATYILLNGQEVDRTTYDQLSDVWASGCYGAGDVDSPMHMPDTNGLCLRGADFLSGNDVFVSTRTALSGVIPFGSGIGSYQVNQIKGHSHVSGSMEQTHPDCIMGGGGEGPGQASSTSSSTTVSTIEGLNKNRPIHFNKSSVQFDVDHTKVYYYIAAA